MSAPSAARSPSSQSGAIDRRARSVRHRLAGASRPKGSDVVIVAGGLGLAPLRPGHLSIFSPTASRYGRVVILFGSRNPEDMLYRHELEQWRRRLDVEIEVTVDHADADWRGNVGVVPALIPRADFRPARSRRA